MKIAVIGTGYVGLTTGTCLSEVGHEVLCIDIDKKKIENLKKGIIPIYEPGLSELVKKNIKKGSLKFSTDSAKAIEFAEVVFSAVGTPPDKNHRADLKAVKEVASLFGKHLDSHKIFVNKSTVPVGTGDLCKKIINEELKKRKVKINFDAVSNPEFLREGQAIKDTMLPDRIVIGCENIRTKKIMKKLYGKFKNAPLLFTDLKSAEIIKYASNAFLATKISFINEIWNFCELCGGNVEKVAKGMGFDKRIGEQFLRAGIGYGGSCFPKDVKALIETGKEYGYEFEIIKSTEKVNASQKLLLYRKLKKHFKNLKGKRIAIWGLAFKPNTDDMREAPAIEIINALQKDGAFIQAYDPVATENAKKILSSKNVKYFTSALAATKNADALLVVTEWEEFSKIPRAKLSKLKIFDGRFVFGGDAGSRTRVQR